MPGKDEKARTTDSARLAAVLAAVAAVLAAVAAYSAWRAARPAPSAAASARDGGEADAGASCADEMRARARQLFERGHYDEAILVLSALTPDDPEVRRLRARAEREARARVLWEEACREESGPGVRQTLCRRIDDESSYSRRTCCGEVAASGAPAGEEGPDGDEEGSPDAGWFSADASATRDAGAEDGPRPAAEALAEAQQCVIRNDQACCVRALSNAERTSRVVNLLINCYHRAGRTEAACQLAARYRRSAAARQFFEARCR